MGCVHGTCCRRNRLRSARPPSGAISSSPGYAGPLMPPPVVGSATVPSHSLVLNYAALSQPGHYPDSPDRVNQDAFLLHPSLAGRPSIHLFAVFDGHGTAGAACAAFARESTLAHLAADPDTLISNPAAAFNTALVKVNKELHANVEIDDSMSGSTAVVAVVMGGDLHVANVGDSRAVAGVWDGNRIVAVALSRDQTPFREDERERVRECGARVLSVEQVEGMRDPSEEGWDEEAGDPPRVWAKDGMYPGTAFTRSVGDSAAESVGVIAAPEVSSVELTPDLRFFVVASDGVFEFISSQAVVDMVASFPDPSDACAAIAAESYKRWLEHENRTDDVTIIVVHIKDNPDIGPVENDQLTHSACKASIASRGLNAKVDAPKPVNEYSSKKALSDEGKLCTPRSPSKQGLSSNDAPR